MFDAVRDFLSRRFTSQGEFDLFDEFRPVLTDPAVFEIANLREGRYPAELFATLQLEGLMGDDEEYWPFEGEYWSDEYENYK